MLTTRDPDKPHVVYSETQIDHTWLITVWTRHMENLSVADRFDQRNRLDLYPLLKDQTRERLRDLFIPNSFKELPTVRKNKVPIKGRNGLSV